MSPRARSAQRTTPHFRLPTPHSTFPLSHSTLLQCRSFWAQLSSPPPRPYPMNFVVIRGSGRIGATLVQTFRHDGHEVLAASRSPGGNTLTGEGLAGALAGAAVVVDVA